MQIRIIIFHKLMKYFTFPGKAQSAMNWRLIMTTFNMIKIIESTGIGLVFGLR